MKKILTIAMFALTIKAYSQKLVKEHYDWAKTKIKREYYTDVYGTLNGSYKAYSEYGGIMKQGQCKDDGPIGKWIENYDNGKLHYIKIHDIPGTYDFQVKDGKIISYYEDGKTIKYERNFKNMKLDGVWKEYDEKGIITKEGKYVNGIFEPTGITKIKYDEEQEKQKQSEAEALLKKTEEYKNIIPKADMAFDAKDHKKALELYKSASDLMVNEKYPKDKISEIKEILHRNSTFFDEFYKNQYDSLKLDKVYFSNLIPVKRSDNYPYPGWNVMKYGKVTNVLLYNNSNCNQDYKLDMPWESSKLYNPEIQSGDYLGSESILNCLISNKALYTPIQILVTQTFIEYVKALIAEKLKIQETKIEYNYDYNKFLYSCDKDVFLNAIKSKKNSYEMAKSLVDLESKSFNKNNQIETLNKANKKKTLYKKTQIVFKDCFLFVQDNTDLQLQYENLNKINLFLDKVITLYAQDTKELETKLQDTETTEQIKTLIFK